MNIVSVNSRRCSASILSKIIRCMSDNGKGKIFEMPPIKKLSKLRTEFQVDQSGLLGMTRDMNDHFSESREIVSDIISNNEEVEKAEEIVADLPHKEIKSPLGKDLTSYIKMRGPITLHDYIAQTSNHAIHGYYQQSSEKIGSSGDFVTSPEISQLFGEMIAIWMLSTWKSLGCPKAISLVELGPGKGTLMKDILRVSSKFPEFRNALSVHMVELSNTMRTLQREALGCDSDPGTSDSGISRMTNNEGIPVSWYSMLNQIPTSGPMLLVAQEFLDAFPVHQFVYTKKGWREKLVDVDLTMESTMHFRSVLSPSSTPASKVLLGEGSERIGLNGRMNTNDTINQVKLSQEDSSAIIADLQIPSPAVGNTASQLLEGDEIEISPLAMGTVDDIAKRVVRTGGAALLIDYGEHFTQGDSLRAFRKHKQTSIYSEPGVVDITSDVDFSLCAKTAAKQGAKVYGSITQGEFLMRMGIVERVESLIEQVKKCLYIDKYVYIHLTVYFTYLTVYR
jgi:NADH dehydrogenase [ubiquinone] 1 alpha subcomplex assembly factor 7